MAPSTSKRGRLSEDSSSVATEGSGKKKKKTLSNKDLEVLLKKTLRADIWPRCCFVSSKEQAKKMAKKTMLLANVAGYDKSAVNKEKLDKWVDDHHDIVVDWLNQLRSYVCDGIKKAVTKFYNEHDRMPDLGVLKDIISRKNIVTGEVTTEDEEESEEPIIPPEWTWWWQKVLPKAAADKHIWPPSVRYYTCISEHVDNTDKPFITPAMEAFALLMIENNYKKWEAMIKYTFQAGNKPIFNFRAMYSEDQKKTEIPGNEYIYLNQQPQFKTKWTKANSGQSKLQGISQDGLTAFIKYRERCQQGRKHSRCLPIERKVLAAVREIEQITQNSHEDWLKEYGKDKRLSSASVPEEVKNLQDWSDDSDDDEEVEPEEV